ncbi:hypothetical protein ACTHAM_002374 [Cellulomonas soli]|uniref:hypothetical protein n=1 Tax=Cellulomonas soli TaxID=931535 RepID=UPI003F84F115
MSPPPTSTAGPVSCGSIDGFATLLARCDITPAAWQVFQTPLIPAGRAFLLSSGRIAVRDAAAFRYRLRLAAERLRAHREYDDHLLATFGRELLAAAGAGFDPGRWA